MKAKLLKKIRRRAADEVTITSITRTGGEITGVAYRYNDSRYGSVCRFGNTEEDVIRKVQHLYFDKVRRYYYKKYKK